MVTYDRAYHVAVAAGMVYFGSSADDKIYALDAVTGRERWSFFTGGPVRTAPTIYEGKVYVGSDDGQIYCLDAADGGLLWTYCPAPTARLLPGNGRIISVVPVRTGVVVDAGVVYFCAGLFPMEGVFLAALSAQDGSQLWQVSPGDLSPQGYLVASKSRLYSPQGRVAPMVFDRRNGATLRSLEGDGGTYALVMDDTLIYGPSARSQLAVYSPEDEDRIATFPGNHMIVCGGISYLHTATTLTALDRARLLPAEHNRDGLARRVERLQRQIRRAAAADKAGLSAELNDVRQQLMDARAQVAQCKRWERPCAQADSLILAGDLLVAGGDGSVAAYRISDGEQVWEASVSGRAYGLAAAGGCLFVSADDGGIYCFGEKTANVSGVPLEPRAYSGPESDAVAAGDAEALTRITGIRKGYSLVLGKETAGLIRALAEHTELQITGVQKDPGDIESARRHLDAAGIYGIRAGIRQLSEQKLPFADYIANLVVWPRLNTTNPASIPLEGILRLVQPCGGVFCATGVDKEAIETVTRNDSDTVWNIKTIDGWQVARRGALRGAGSWTQMYGDASNASCGDEQRIRVPMRLQWWGLPGPREMVDRHHRGVAPLSRDGRLYIPGDNRIITLDAYNGTRLWEEKIPVSRRLGAPFDSPNMAAGDDGKLYLAVKRACLVLDAETGKRLRILPVPQHGAGQNREWGYLSMEGELLFGTGRKPAAVYNRIGWASDAYQWGDFKRMVTSGYFFSMDRATGQTRWLYEGGTIVNPAIAVGGGRVYLVESPAPEAAEDKDGRIDLPTLFKNGGRIVALDMSSGDEIWRWEGDLRMFEQIIFLSYAKEILLVAGSRNVGRALWHVLHAFDARTGSVLWRRENDTGWGIGGGHGEQTRHPAIVGHIIYAEPYAYELSTGEPLSWRMDRGGGGCGTLSASASCLFFRGKNPQMYDIAAEIRRPLNHVTRPGCWINMIPANGLLLIPEASSGCTCAYPLQTSLAYIPAPG